MTPNCGDMWEYIRRTKSVAGLPMWSDNELVELFAADWDTMKYWAEANGFRLDAFADWSQRVGDVRSMVATEIATRAQRKAERDEDDDGEWPDSRYDNDEDWLYGADSDPSERDIDGMGF